MRRKIIRSNIKWLNRNFSSIKRIVVEPVPKLPTIAESKLRGQQCHSERLKKDKVFEPATTQEIKEKKEIRPLLHQPI